ncbi:MAG: N-acetylmuramoyl-L-alanine amidase [bacterium]
MSTFLIFAGDARIDIGRRVFTYREHDTDPRVPSFYAPGDARRRFTRLRDVLTELTGGGDSEATAQGKRRSMVKRVVLHHDGMPTSAGCFQVLVQRNLSTHIMIDHDGTIWQPLALSDIAWHAGDPHNGESIGIDLCNPVKPGRVDLAEAQQRGLFEGLINGGKVKSLGYTEAQYESLLAVLEGLIGFFNLRRQAPVDEAGKVVRNKLVNTDFPGVVGHQHISANKWDPGPGFDWERILIGIRGNRFFFPVTLPGARNLAHVPKREAKTQAEAYFRHIETGDGGFFPVGVNQAWHSGVHLVTPAIDEKKNRVPVLAPADGVIVAARNIPRRQWEKMGSPNMVLLRHDLKIRDVKRAFWTVISHLDAEKLGRESDLKWMQDLEAQDGPAGLPDSDGRPLTSAEGAVALKSGLVALIKVPVKAGDLLGHVGRFSPDPDGEGIADLVDFALLSAKPLVTDGTFELDETDDDPGLLCNSRHVWKRYTEDPAELQGLIDGGYPLAPPEVRDFYASNRRAEDLRWLAARHVTEYSDETDFSGLFGGGVDFEWALREKAERHLKRIRPFLWWDKGVTDHASLPKDRFVYTWHPIALLTSMAIEEARSAFEVDEKVKGFSDEDARKERLKDAAAERDLAEKQGSSIEHGVFGRFDDTKDIQETAQDADAEDDDDFELENWMRWEQGEWPPPD